MSSPNDAALLASLVAALVTTLGIGLVARYQNITDRYLIPLSAFAAAIVVTAALVHIYPESQELNPDAAMYVLFGYVFLLLIHVLTDRHEGDGKTSLAVLAPVLGISFHSFVDGLIYGTVFSVDVFTGIVAVSGLVLHEFAEGIILFVLVRAAGFSTSKAAIAALLGAALTTPAGALVSIYVLKDVSQSTLGLLLAMAGGALLNVSASHLAGHFMKGRPFPVIFVYLLGIALSLLVFSGHKH